MNNTTLDLEAFLKSVDLEAYGYDLVQIQYQAGPEAYFLTAKDFVSAEHEIAIMWISPTLMYFFTTPDLPLTAAGEEVKKLLRNTTAPLHADPTTWISRVEIDMVEPELNDGHVFATTSYTLPVPEKCLEESQGIQWLRIMVGATIARMLKESSAILSKCNETIRSLQVDPHDETKTVH